MTALNRIKALKARNLESAAKPGQTVCSVVRDSLYCDEEFCLAIFALRPMFAHGNLEEFFESSRLLK